MGRLNLEEPEQTLEELIPSYYFNKQELDSYKELCDKENAEIKKLMADANEYTVECYKAKKTVSVRETLNEERLMAVIKKYNIEGVIMTKEYVDMDALESYLYKNEPSSELATELAKCKDSKEVVQLRVTRVKEK